MKKIATLTLGSLFALSAAAQSFSDDFESYTAGSKLGPQSPDWTTWSAADGGTEDVYVVTTAAHSGTQSIYFSSTSASGGPTDCVLPFGGQYNTGSFMFDAWFKVPASKSAYFNFQANTTIGAAWALDFNMNSDGTYSVSNGSAVLLSGTYPQGSWFDLTFNINLNSNNWELLFNGVSEGSFSNPTDQIAAIDIYPANASASYWVDDVSYSVTPYTMPAVNGATNVLNITNGLVGQSRNASLTVRNLGTTTITSFDVAVIQNGGAPVTQSVTGASIPSLGTSVVNITTPFTLAAGTNQFIGVISNVNGGGPDNDNTDDSITVTLTPVAPATGKMVVVEEGTGTWCQWCPRGAVYMDMMNTKYDGYFAGIAVHNSDPMTVTAYDAAVSAQITGYPSVLIDRASTQDPSAMEPDFLNRVTIAPKSFVVNGATYNSTTRVLNVSVTNTIQQNISGNYKVACVITEDSVTGTASTYNQANAYAGGGAGVMGGFETLPNPVPASMMNYNHVARAITPDFTGVPNAFGASATTGQIFTYNFTYTLPASWDPNQIHIVGLFIDPAGKIDNASSATIAEAVTNGFVTGTPVGTTAVNNISAPDAEVTLYPNPANTAATVTISLQHASSVQIAVFGVDGSLVAKRDYGMMNGAMALPLELNELKAGMYFVNVVIDGKTSVMKLIKE